MNDAAQELTGKLGRPFVSEYRMAAVSNTVQPTDKSKSGACRKHGITKLLFPNKYWA